MEVLREEGIDGVLYSMPRREELKEVTARQRGPQPLGPPKKGTDLPYFAYGLFKPGELAYEQIEDFLDGDPVAVQVPGALHVRDGLPLLRYGGRDIVHGYLLRFQEDKAEKAYGKIGDFEPKKHYRWRRVRLKTGELVNALLGEHPDRGAILNKEGVWRGRQDPVLATGVFAVREVADQWAGEKFISKPVLDELEWIRLFRLQMAYLFLWTIIERYASLSYGPALKSELKVEKFGEDRAFEQALKRVVTRKRNKPLYDSQDPEMEPAYLDPASPASSVKYYRRVRNNLTHRGKGAWNDGEIVRHSLLELQEIVRQVLVERMGLKIETAPAEAAAQGL